MISTCVYSYVACHIKVFDDKFIGSKISDTIVEYVKYLHKIPK